MTSSFEPPDLPDGLVDLLLEGPPVLRAERMASARRHLDHGPHPSAIQVADAVVAEARVPQHA